MEENIKITVPFYDVDPMRVVWHGNYAKYFEQARCAFLDRINLTYNEMEKTGYLFPIVEMKVKYIRPCVFGQRINVCARLVPCDNFLIFKYVITDEALKTPLCKAETRQMCVRKKDGESLFVLPDVLLERLREIK